MVHEGPLAAAQQLKAGRRRLALAAAFSIGLHALLLVRWPGLPQGGSADREAPAAVVIAARIVPVLPTEAATAAAAPPQRPPPAVPPTPGLAATPATPAAKPAVPQSPATAQPSAAPPAAAPQLAPTPRDVSTLPARPEYRGDGLDPPPRPLSDIEPEYPATAQMREGTVVLRLLLDAEGKLDEIAVLRASPPGLFDASALAAFGNAKYAPGYYRGKPVKSQITIAIDYTPTNRGSAVSGAGN